MVVYDAATYAFISTPQERPGLSSYQLDQMKLNSDLSVTIYMGPKAPAGLESNWIPTRGKQPFTLVRFYGPKQEMFDKSFKLNDWVKVD